MRQVRRLFSAFLALAMLLSVAAFPADAADNNYKLAVVKVQKLTEGTSFNANTADEATNVAAGDIVVLTIAFQNNSSASVRTAGFTAKVYYDSGKVTPYTGTSPFASRAYQLNSTLSDMDGDYGWSQSGNVSQADAFISGTGGGSNPYTVPAGGELVVLRLPFRVQDPTAEFRFDTDVSRVIDQNRSPFSVDMPSYNLTTGEVGEDKPENPENPDNPDNPETPGEEEPQSDYELAFSKTQKLTIGTAFNADTAEETSAAKPNEVVVLTISAKNNTTSAIRTAGFTAKVYYDSDKVTPYTGTPPFASRAYQLNSTLSDMDGDYGWSQSGNVSQADKFISGTGGGSNPYTIPANGELVVLRLAFQVNANATDGTAEFRFDKDTSRVIDQNRSPFTVGMPAYHLVIGDITPTVTPATATLTVPNTGAATRKFTAKDQGGNAIADSALTWALDKTITGVDIDAGTVTVASNADITAKTDVTVTATVGRTKPGTATLTIQPKGSGGGDEPSETLVATVDGQKAVTAEEGKETTFKAEVKDADGETVTGAKWFVTKADGSSAENSGVSVNADTGEVSVADNAEPGDYIIRAEKGDEWAEVSLKVGNEAAPASLSVTLTPASVTVSADEDKTVTAAAQAKDADNNDVTTPALRWSLSGAPTGVSIDEDTGEITVSSSANVAGQVTVTVTATAKDNSALTGSAQLTISGSGTPGVVTLNRVELAPATVAAGTAAPVVAKAIGSDNNPIASGVTWTITGGLTISSDGAFTVPATAQAGVSYTVTASYNGQTATATLTVSDGSASAEAISVSSVDGRSSIEIPGVNSASETESAAFRAIDRKTGATITSGIVWSINAKIKGVSIDPATGVLTVERSAKDDITDTPDASGLKGRTVVVTATRESDEEWASASIVIRRDDPVFSKVALFLDNAEVSNPVVAVDGTGAQTLTAVAQDQYEETLEGSAMDGSFTWNAFTVRADRSKINVPGNGVTVPPNATAARVTVTVSASAQEGTYSVEAVQGGATYGAEMTVSRELERADSLTVSEGQAEILIPGKDEAAALSTRFNALALNQYGNVMSGADITWDLLDAFGNKVSADDQSDESAAFRIEDGVLKVGYSAKNTVPDTVGQRFTVRARAVSGEVSGTASILVKRADPYLKYTALRYNGLDTQPLNVPIDSAVQGEALDQYETPIAVTWTVTPVGYGSGVTADSSTNVITVAQNAVLGNYNVTATDAKNNSVGPKTITVYRGDPTPASVVVSGGQPSVYVPGDGLTTSATPYVAAVTDQLGYPYPLTDQSVINWTIADSSGNQEPGITITGSIENGVARGVVTVSNVSGDIKNVVTAANPEIEMFVRATFVAADGTSVTSQPVSVLVRRAAPTLAQARVDTTLSENGIAVIEYDGVGSKAVAVQALDQYGDLFSGASWQLSSLNSTGVSVNAASGSLTISPGAVEGVVHTVTAKYGAQSASADFRISRTAFNAMQLGGIVIDYPTVTVSANNPLGAGAQATARNSADPPQTITDGILWTVYPDNAGVEINAKTGRIQVSPNAQARTYVITATPDTAFGVVTGDAQHTDFTVVSATPTSIELDHVTLQENLITVDGTADRHTQVVPYGTDGTVVTGVTWSISPSDGGAFFGSTSDSTIAITISRNAPTSVYTIQGVKGSATKTATLSVRNETPTTAIANVTLDPATVTLDGSKAESSTARAVDSSNQPLTGVTWSVSPANQGVTVGSDGAITIGAATPADSYEIIASYSGATRSEFLRVNRSDSNPGTVTLSRVSLSASSVTVDGTEAKSATATAIGSDNNPITTGITWSVSPTDGGVSVNASTGVISVTATANSGDYTITAARGTERRSATFSVSNTAAPLTSAYTVTVTPTSVSVNGSTARTAQAAATSNDAPVTGGILWSVEPEGSGVSINVSSGRIAVSATAAAGSYTVKGTRGAESHSATLTVTSTARSALASVALSQSAVNLNGAAATVTATAYNSSNVAITNATWSVSPADNGVSIDGNGQISVAATAVEGDYTVSATYQNVVRSATLSVSGGVTVEYQNATGKDPAVADTPLESLSLTASGVKSASDQAGMKSAALSLAKVQSDIANAPAGSETEVIVSTEIRLKSYNPLVASVTPTYEVIRKNADGTQTSLYKEPLTELDAPVTISLNVPSDCDAVFAKHSHTDAKTNRETVYYEPISYSGTADNRVASWTQQYFSDVELTKEAVTVTFDADGGTVSPTTKTVNANGRLVNANGQLDAPTPIRSGYTFGGWYLNSERVDVYTVFTKAETLVARWTARSSGGSSSGGGGGGGSSSGGSSSGGSSSGSSGSSSTVSYTITLSSGVGGTLSSSAKKATAETVITVLPTPNAGYILDTLSVTTRAGRDVDFSVSNGTYSFEMPKASVTVTATFKRSASANTDNGNTGTSGNSGNSGNTTPNPYYSISFVDMPPDNFFYTAVQWAVERGITNGTTATTFSPNQACTRAQMVMFLWRSQGMPMPSTNYSPFVDVDPGANYYTAMLWAVERGITNGTTATTFEPYSPCTRAQMVMFLWRVAGRPTPTKTDCPFTDITVGENYYVPMLWALETGITNGTTATTFSPYQACTRAQMVMFLYRYLGGN